ncbi:hypothetical protein CULT_1680004 [[Clostridium] ultunense Esp]|uniref:putative sporulation protein YtxC n=1 Tax=Thermicanus aegyptius TaxID=94009 RepID=UPI0002B70447|nr:putative sporulation protein YtxC [Thermicanus aegyptius]CCQ94103.1 hypothetical protein CULT_1680004 [[Clostridium] ultunense Esp]
MFTIYVEKNRASLLEDHLSGYRPAVQGEWAYIKVRELNHGLFDGLTRLVENGYEKVEYREILKKQFHFEKEMEIEAILRFLDSFLQGEDGGEETRRTRMAEEIAQLLTERLSIHMGGYYRFRWRKRVEAEIDLLERAIDEYLMDREYQEYVDFLREYTEGREAKREEIHLVHRGSRHFLLLHHDGTPIQLKREDGAEGEKEGFDEEDQVFTDLLNLSPKRIILHTRERDFHLVRTIAQVFPERITYCNGCFMCEADWNRMRT